MLLYLMAIQTIVLFVAHLVSCGISGTILTTLMLLAVSSLGGYALHSRNIPDFLRWGEVLSLEKWILPLLTEQEYSPETIAALTSQQMCRNKQVTYRNLCICVSRRTQDSAFLQRRKFLRFDINARFCV